jgi:hypothetical protein
MHFQLSQDIIGDISVSWVKSVDIGTWDLGSHVLPCAGLIGFGVVK